MDDKMIDNIPTPEEPKNPFDDNFKAKWWERYNHEPKWCTLENLQTLYTYNKLTRDDFVTITGENPIDVEPPVDQMEILSTNVVDILQYTVELDFRLANIEMFL